MSPDSRTNRSAEAERFLDTAFDGPPPRRRQRAWFGVTSVASRLVDHSVFSSSKVYVSAGQLELGAQLLGRRTRPRVLLGRFDERRDRPERSRRGRRD